jgi:hypothetical protein
VDIAWADGNQRQYTFRIETSTDGSSFSNVFSGKSSGTTTSPQKYSFDESPARYVRITITESHVGSSNSIAQISEIDVFGKSSASASSTSFASESSQLSTASSDSKAENNKGATGGSVRSGITTTANHMPVAKNDLTRTESNQPLLISVLANDNDPDGDKLEITSVESFTEKGSFVRVNENGDLVFTPALDFVGRDTFSYSISDGNGGSDNAKVTVVVSKVADSDRVLKNTHPSTVETNKDQGSTQQDNTDLPDEAPLEENAKQFKSDLIVPPPPNDERTNGTIQ